MPELNLKTTNERLRQKIRTLFDEEQFAILLTSGDKATVRKTLELFTQFNEVLDEVLYRPLSDNSFITNSPHIVKRDIVDFLAASSEHLEELKKAAKDRGISYE